MTGPWELPGIGPRGSDSPSGTILRVSDDPLRDLTHHSRNAHEVLLRRDVDLAAPEAATFAA